MPKNTKQSVYDQLRSLLHSETLASDLGLVIVSSDGSEIEMQPLCHESSSNRSLHLNKHSGRWVCRSCGFGGDLIQLAEYALTGGNAPSKGPEQHLEATHQDALRWLCERYGVVYEEGSSFGDQSLQFLNFITEEAHLELLGRPEVLEVVHAQWGFDQSTVEQYQLGFIPSPLPVGIVDTAKQNPGAFRASGFGWVNNDGEVVTPFAGRIIFPYLEHGRTVYLIGRATKWTKTRDGKGTAKYYKLPVHSDRRPYISDRITNEHLYNESILSTTKRVVITEGVADAVALSSIGVPVVSPVTITMNAVDVVRFVDKCKANGITSIEVLFDNELSGSGGHGAKKLARGLVESGFPVKILELPRGETQQAAFDELRSRFPKGQFEEYQKLDPTEKKKLVEQLFPDDGERTWVKQQILATKIDAAEWVAQQGAGAAGRFDALSNSGADFINQEIEKALAEMDMDDPSHERFEVLREVLGLIGHLSNGMIRDGYCGVIAKASGKGITKANLVREVNRIIKEFIKPMRKDAQDERAKVERGGMPDLTPPPPVLDRGVAPPPIGGAPLQEDAPPADPNAPKPPPPPSAPGEEEAKEDADLLTRFATMRANVLRHVEDKSAVDYVAESVYGILTVSLGYESYRCGDDIVLIKGNGRIDLIARQGSRYMQLLLCVSGLDYSNSKHKTYINFTSAIFGIKSRKTDIVTWSHIGEPGEAWVDYPTAGGDVLHITPKGVTASSMATARVPAIHGPDFRAFKYLGPDAYGGIEEAIDAMRWTSLHEFDRVFLVHWAAMNPILRWIGHIPIFRIEGGSSSGKSRVMDAMSELMNGRQSAAVPTAAALTSHLAINQITFDDNREADDMNKAFVSTLLQTTQLGAKSKRKGNTDTEVIRERSCGALMMTGVEPIHGGKVELSSRIVVLRAHASRRLKDSPTDDRLLLRIRNLRDAFWSDSVNRCAQVMALVPEYGEHLSEQIELHFKRSRVGRMSIYFRAMYLSWALTQDPGRQQKLFENLDPLWVNGIKRLDQKTVDSIAQDTLAHRVIVAAMKYCQLQRENTTPDSVDMFKNKDYEWRQERDGTQVLDSIPMKALGLLARVACKDLGESVMKGISASVLEARMLDSIELLKATGIEAEAKSYGQQGRRRWTIRIPMLGDDPTPSDADNMDLPD